MLQRHGNLFRSLDVQVGVSEMRHIGHQDNGFAGGSEQGRLQPRDDFVLHQVHGRQLERLRVGFLAGVDVGAHPAAVGIRNPQVKNTF